MEQKSVEQEMGQFKNLIEHHAKVKLQQSLLYWEELTVFNKFLELFKKRYSKIYNVCCANFPTKNNYFLNKTEAQEFYKTQPLLEKMFYIYDTELDLIDDIVRKYLTEPELIKQLQI